MKNRILKLSYLFFVAILFNSCAEDSPSSAQKDNFMKFYGDVYDNEAADIIQIENNYYLLINRTNGEDESYFFIQCVDAYGNTSIRTEFKSEGGENVFGKSLASLENGNIAITGYVTTDADSLFDDIFLKIIDRDLLQVFDTVYNTLGYECGYRIAEIIGGGYFVYGTQRNSELGVINRIHYPISTDYTIENSGFDGIINEERIGKISSLESGEFLLAGNVTLIADNEADVLHFDATGKLQDQYLSGIDGFFQEVVVLEGNQMVICGTKTTGRSGGTDAYVALYDIDQRTMLWETELGGSWNDEATSLVINSNNEIIVAGTKSNSDAASNIYVFKLDVSNGELLDEVLLGEQDTETAIHIFADENNPNSFMVFGNTSKSSNSSTVLIKTSF